jgi:hypothetical protein
MERTTCYAMAMLTTLIFMACLASDSNDTATVAVSAPTMTETHQIEACDEGAHVFQGGHAALKYAIADLGDRESVVWSMRDSNGVWDFECPDEPATLHIFWGD